MCYVQAMYIAALSPVVSVVTVPDVGASFVPVTGGGINVTAGFGAGSDVELTLTMTGNVAPEQICPTATGCSYRLYGGSSFRTPYCCCPTDYTWSAAYQWGR